jgi:hypothetical protein
MSEPEFINDKIKIVYLTFHEYEHDILETAVQDLFYNAYIAPKNTDEILLIAKFESTRNVLLRPKYPYRLSGINLAEDHSSYKIDMVTDEFAIVSSDENNYQIWFNSDEKANQTKSIKQTYEK